MKLKYILVTFTISLLVCAEGRKTSGRSRGSGSGSGRGTSRKSNPQPAPTSFSYSQASAPKPTLFGWQERPAQKSNSQSLSTWQAKPSGGQSHSYPSSGTGLSGDKSKQSATNQESIQRSSASNSQANQRTNNQQTHSYPSSNGGLSGGSSGYPQQNANKYPQQQGTGLSGTGQASYPQGQGLSGTGQAGHSYPHGSGSGYPQQTQHNTGVAGSAGAPPPYSAGAPPAYSGAAPPAYSGAAPYNNGHNYQNYGNHYQNPPPPYSNHQPNYGYNSYNPGFSPQSPGYFGNYGNYGKNNYGGVSRAGSALTGVGIAGAGIGTVLTGLALWNLARSTGTHHHTVIYDNRGQPVAVAPSNGTEPVADSILADLVNCSLTISNDVKTEVLAIPCSIATSFTPGADVKESGVNENSNDNTKCTITVLTKAGKEFMTTIPCSILLNTAAENNVTEPVINEPANNANVTSDATVQNNTYVGEPTALKLSDENVRVDDGNSGNLNCTPQPGETRDPINPCFSVNHNLTVIPLPSSEAPQ